MSDTITEAHRLGYAQGKAAGDAFGTGIKEYVQRLEAERDALRAENERLQDGLIAIDPLIEPEHRELAMKRLNAKTRNTVQDFYLTEERKINRREEE